MTFEHHLGNALVVLAAQAMAEAKRSQHMMSMITTTTMASQADPQANSSMKNAIASDHPGSGALALHSDNLEPHEVRQAQADVQDFEKHAAEFTARAKEADRKSQRLREAGHVQEATTAAALGDRWRKQAAQVSAG